ncbi:MAG: hypothetical protein JW861_08845 [Bacteroidales bacterium]|nr:hypothetical protein [Bacteroidales bacterium]
MRAIGLTLFILLSISLFAQKMDLIESTEDVIDRARTELDAAMSAPEGEFYLWGQEKGIRGEYIIDLTIREKGEVATVFCQGNEGGTIGSQNLLKDHLKEFKFGFKMPKGKSYKFQYRFIFVN